MLAKWLEAETQGPYLQAQCAHMALLEEPIGRHKGSGLQHWARLAAVDTSFCCRQDEIHVLEKIAKRASCMAVRAQ